MRSGARFRDPAGREHARHFTRKVDAQRWLDSVTAAVAVGTYVDPKAGQTSPGEYAQIWLIRQVHLKPSTRSRYGSIVRCHLVPAFGSTPLAKIEHRAVAAWIVDLLDDDIAAPTVRHLHRVLHMILNSAIDDGRLARNAAARVKLPRDRSRDKRFLSAASLAVAAGANVKAVQRMLGHASAAMTLVVYSGLFDDDLDVVADRLDVASQAARESVSRTSCGLFAD